MLKSIMTIAVWSYSYNKLFIYSFLYLCKTCVCACVGNNDEKLSNHVQDIALCFELIKRYRNK